jgi:hypothetical protein
MSGLTLIFGYKKENEIMPYIAQQRRESFQGFLDKTKDLRIDTSGELNFLVVNLMLIYLNQHGENYRVLNEIVGATTCAQTEFIRRKLIPLEETKCAENGDVFLVPGATE